MSGSIPVRDADDWPPVDGLSEMEDDQVAPLDEMFDPVTTPASGPVLVGSGMPLVSPRAMDIAYLVACVVAVVVCTGAPLSLTRAVALLVLLGALAELTISLRLSVARVTALLVTGSAAYVSDSSTLPALVAAVWLAAWTWRRS